MPVDSEAQQSYESNATQDKWEQGVEDADDTPSGGLEDAGVDMAGRGSELDSAWRDGTDDADYEPDGDAWISSMQDASDWNIG